MRVLVRDATKYEEVNTYKLFAGGIMLLSGECVDNDDIIHISDDIRTSRAQCSRCGRITKLDDKCQNCRTRRHFALFDNRVGCMELGVAPMMGINVKFGTKAALMNVFNHTDAHAQILDT